MIATPPDRIFIVEDEALIAMEIEDRLSNLGYAVCGIARRGEDAIEMIARHRPDLVLMDIKLAGGIDGIETARRLRDRFSLPVVYLTAFSDDALIQDARATDPLGYLVKPFEERELHAIIQTSLAKHRLEQAAKESHRRLEVMVRERTADLAASEARLREAQRIARVGDWQADTTTGEIRWSEVLYEIFGRDPDTYRPTIETYFVDNVHPDDVAAVRREYEEALVDGGRRRVEHRFRRADGGEGWIGLECIAEAEAGGAIVRLRGTAQDITEHKRKDQALADLSATLAERVAERTAQLAASERFARGILDSMGSHVAVLDRHGRIVATNDAWRRFASANGLQWPFFGPEINYLEVCEGVSGPDAADARAVAAGIRDVIAGRRGQFQIDLEYPCHSPGEQRWFVCRATPLVADDLGRVVVSHDDVTAVHRAIERFATGERTFASLAQVSPVGIFQADADGQCNNVNRRWCEITGYSAANALGAGWLHALHPDDRGRIGDEWTRFLRHGRPFHTEYRFLRPDGTTRWVVGEALRIGNAAGGVSGSIGTITDITDQKRIEMALRALSADLVTVEGTAYFEAAARRLASLLETDIACIARLDPGQPGQLVVLAFVDDGKVVPAFTYPIEGTPCAVALGGEIVVVETGVAELYPEDRYLAERGIESYAAIPIRDPAGRPIGTVAVLGRQPFRDVSAAETILKMFSVAIGGALTRERNRRQFEDLFDFAPKALVMTDDEGRIERINREAERIFGWPRDEAIGQSVEILVPSNLRERHARHLRDFVASGADGLRRMGASRPGLAARRKDGTSFPVEIDLAPVRTEDGIRIAAAIEDISERTAIQAALAASRANLEAALESIDRGLILYDADDRVLIFNSQVIDLFPGLGDLVQVGARFEDIARATATRGLCLLPEGATIESFIALRLDMHRRRDGHALTQRLSDGRVLHVAEYAARNGGTVGTYADVTEHLRVESQLRAAQKMEAIGQLTGGMAHDFNNYLGVIIGNLDLLVDGGIDDPTARRRVDEALSAALRGADLTKSLLAFARRQPLAPSVCDINQRIEGIVGLLRRTLGERIEIVTSLAPDIWPVRVDEAQFDSCVINIASNARDAMPNGGVLRITTRNHFDHLPRRGSEMPTGDHVTIEIADTGIGMSPDVVDRIFDPFFSTKGPAHGTGLGLSMVLGFVRQSGGHIGVDSRPNEGTSIRIFLPRQAARRPTTENAGAPGEAEPLSVTTETILVVDDNELMRQAAATQLASLGYRVIEARNGDAAREILERDDPPVDLLFTDVIMPGTLDGYALARLAVERRPGIQVLLTSGFPGESLGGAGPGAAGFRLLSKPYRRQELARAIRDVLKGAAPVTRAGDPG